MLQDRDDEGGSTSPAGTHLASADPPHYLTMPPALSQPLYVAADLMLRAAKASESGFGQLKSGNLLGLYHHHHGRAKVKPQGGHHGCHRCDHEGGA